MHRTEEGTSIHELSALVREIIERNGFRVNDRKVRLSEEIHRQEVTGLIVNQRVNVKRRLIREVRAMLHAWRKFGLASAQGDFQARFGGSSNFEAVTRGKIEFIGQIRGRPDPIFRKLAQQFNQLTLGGKIRTILTPEEIIKQAVWVLEHDGSEQGTAFFLAQVGLITCAHCLGENMYIYHPADHTKRFPVTALKSDAHRDLALLSTPTELSGLIPVPGYQGSRVMSPVVV
jgi:hypothetical protein